MRCDLDSFAEIEKILHLKEVSTWSTNTAGIHLLLGYSVQSFHLHNVIRLIRKKLLA